MLSDNGGCVFPINMTKNDDLQTTFGCDISPPLPIIHPLPWTKKVPQIGQIKYLTFVDFEGMKIGQNDDLIAFVKETFIEKYPCILILSALLTLDENDLNLLKELFECNQENPLILALSSPNIDGIEHSANYLKINHEIDYFGELRLCQLPFFDEGRKGKNAEIQSSIPYKSPLEFMTHREKTQYFDLSLKVLEVITICNQNRNYLGVSSQQMMQLLDDIQCKKQCKNEAKLEEKLL